MKWKTYIWIVLCLFSGNVVSAQHFIGEHKSQVRKLMTEQRKELFIDESSRNTVYNTLKYIDRMGNQTLLFVFSEQDTCLYTKWMYDYFMLNKVISELNESYAQSDEDTWHYVSGKQSYIITLTTDDWFFTITTRQQELD